MLIFREYRDGVQVLGVGGRGDQVHVVNPPSTLSGMHPHPQLSVSGVVAHTDVTQNSSKRQRMGGDALAPLRIDTRDTVKVKKSKIKVLSKLLQIDQKCL